MNLRAFEPNLQTLLSSVVPPFEHVVYPLVGSGGL